MPEAANQSDGRFLLELEPPVAANPPVERFCLDLAPPEATGGVHDESRRLKQTSRSSRRNAKRVRFRMEEDADLIGKLFEEFEDNIESVFGLSIDRSDKNVFNALPWLLK